MLHPKLWNDRAVRRAFTGALTSSTVAT